MSARVRFVLRERGIMRKSITKKLERRVESEKRTSVSKTEGDVVLEGIFILPVGRTSRCFVTDAHYCSCVS